MARLMVNSYRFVPESLAYHHILMIFLATTIVVLSILLAGCTSSNSLTNVYLLSISYLNSTIPSPKIDPAQVNSNISNIFPEFTGVGTSSSTFLEVRAGYMGMCISQNAGIWLCSSSATTLANVIKKQAPALASIQGGGDPLNLIWIAGKFKSEIIFDGLIFTAVALTSITVLLLALFSGWHEEADDEGSEREVKPFPSRRVSLLALAITALASLFVIVSILWQHIATSAAASMIRSLSYGTVRGTVGPAAMALGWVGVFLSVIVTIGLLIMVLSIRALSHLMVPPNNQRSAGLASSYLS